MTHQQPRQCVCRPSARTNGMPLLHTRTRTRLETLGFASACDQYAAKPTVKSHDRKGFMGVAKQLLEKWMRACCVSHASNDIGIPRSIECLAQRTAKGQARHINRLDQKDPGGVGVGGPLPLGGYSTFPPSFAASFPKFYFGLPEISAGFFRRGLTPKNLGAGNE
jgi:hypothetical protein